MHSRRYDRPCDRSGTGRELWNLETGVRRTASPTVADGTVYVGSDDGRVYAFDAGVEGSSEDSRVMLGTLGHHEGWTGPQGSESNGRDDHPASASRSPARSMAFSSS